MGDERSREMGEWEEGWERDTGIDWGMREGAGQRVGDGQLGEGERERTCVPVCSERGRKQRKRERSLAGFDLSGTDEKEKGDRERRNRINEKQEVDDEKKNTGGFINKERLTLPHIKNYFALDSTNVLNSCKHSYSGCCIIAYLML